MIRVFIDGRAGTTGLQIEERLRRMPQVSLLDIPESERKNPKARQTCFAEADAVFLCLPDEAAREAAVLAEGTTAVLFDASTAHRTHSDWAYGFPELSAEHLEHIRSFGQIAVPGCHATGFCALVYPLTQKGVVKPRDTLSCFSLTGYSGGGKAMIAEYEGEQPPRGARPYALGLTHKHLPEMRAQCALDTAPVFLPVLAPVRQGMIVSVPLAANARMLYDILAAHYEGAAHVHVQAFGGADCLEAGRLDMEARNGTDDLDIFVFGHETQALLCARFDNLGKGASGAAVQCLRLRFGT